MINEKDTILTFTIGDLEDYIVESYGAPDKDGLPEIPHEIIHEAGQWIAKDFEWNAVYESIGNILEYRMGSTLSVLCEVKNP